MDPGEGGSAVYAAVVNYAHNAGKAFIGDPARLSDAALYRRTGAMLASALKFGTTNKHLEPPEYQLRDNSDPSWRTRAEMAEWGRRRKRPVHDRRYNQDDRTQCQ